jgi:hypothetical protein
MIMPIRMNTGAAGSSKTPSSVGCREVHGTAILDGSNNLYTLCSDTGRQKPFTSHA